jgi:hypothetical protein
VPPAGAHDRSKRSRSTDRDHLATTCTFRDVPLPPTFGGDAFGV